MEDKRCQFCGSQADTMFTVPLLGSLGLGMWLGYHCRCCSESWTRFLNTARKPRATPSETPLKIQVGQ